MRNDSSLAVKCGVFCYRTRCSGKEWKDHVMTACTVRFISKKKMASKGKENQNAYKSPMEGLMQGIQMSLTSLDICLGDTSRLYEMTF